MRQPVKIRFYHIGKPVRSGLTLVEMAVAVTVMAIVVAAVLPVLAGVRNSADTRWAVSEMIQNARVANEHLSRHLGGAKRITDVSPGSETNGYIEFEAAGGEIRRYEVSSEGGIEFGAPGSLCELAGPVASLIFACYDVNDLARPVAVADRIRFVSWELTLRSTGPLTANRTFTGAAYLRANGNTLWDLASASYDFATRQEGVEAFAYAGEGKPQVPTTPNTPSGALTSPEYDTIEADDGDSYTTTTLSQANFSRMRFVFRIDQDRDRVVRIAGTWNGRGINLHEARMDGASLYIWNYRSGVYQLLAASEDTEAEVVVAGSVQESAADGIGGPGGDAVTLLLVLNDKITGQNGNQLSTDYVGLEITERVERGQVLP